MQQKDKLIIKIKIRSLLKIYDSRVSTYKIQNKINVINIKIVAIKIVEEIRKVKETKIRIQQENLVLR